MYLIIYSFVPEKALLGRKDVATTLLSLSYFFLLVSASLWIEYYLKIRLLNLYSTFGLFMVLYVTCRIVYIEPSRFKKIINKYDNGTKWIYKTLGILFFALSFFSQIISGIALTALKN
jgi:hypothetical protein